ncbi:thiopeptide-type bacteriocin biosynthesis domain-containing protein [Sinomicrobium oceani]|uniref:Thiopeptide-type bacteriocin biosynthesis domain-containing protein n=1 Tax=Sinomicrobium oceani TaxID=1150368 RepID=A0A1K1M8N1_9FLAO|nr:thiopeptide-type bacteriocin biosynthesis protein [Sinomicrobium oceani]SFW18326.1 thiopeptide-type bacteriocin biosynthesis domain-containing protein [Sinomicrobium oceani]
MEQHPWIAAHIYYPGNTDKVLQHLLRPFLDEVQTILHPFTPWFFIRYWKQGSHIRFRLNPLPGQEDHIRQELQKQANAFFRQYPAVPEQHDRHYSAPVALRFEPYIPETERYGNAKSLPAAEHLFYTSSAFVLERFAEIHKASLLIESLRMQLITLWATGWDERRLVHICTLFIEGWLPRLYDPALEQTAQKAHWMAVFKQSFNRHADQIIPAFGAFRKALLKGHTDHRSQQFYTNHTRMFETYENYRFTPEKMNAIVGSFLHMNNNRLGISNHEEAYGMYCTCKCIQHINHDQNPE